MPHAQNIEKILLLP